MSWLIGSICGGSKPARRGIACAPRRLGAAAASVFAVPDLRPEPRFLRGAMTCAPLQ
jgi:hypothetical protein